MLIKKSRDMGFCFGVRRAVDMMKEAAIDGRKVQTLGQVVHNPQVVAELEEIGISVKQDRAADGATTDTVAITAHGVGESTVNDIKGQGFNVIDTTCQFVARSQRAAKHLADKGFTIIIFGDPEHPEVKGVLGWCKGRGIVVKDESLEGLPEYIPSKIGVISQTTHTPERYADFVSNLMRARIDQITEIRIVNVLCNATTSQQAATRELAEEVDKDPRLVEVILRESSEVVAHKPGVLVVAHKLGVVLANAGIDRSNVAPEPNSEPVLLLPVDPNASAAALKARLDAHFDAALGVVVSDSVGRAWRNGITGIALGTAGLPALRDLIGRADLFGRRLEVTKTGFADEIAAAASLVMGQADEGLPAVLVSGLSWREPENDATALLRPKDEDLFR